MAPDIPEHVPLHRLYTKPEGRHRQHPSIDHRRRDTSTLPPHPYRRRIRRPRDSNPPAPCRFVEVPPGLKDAVPIPQLTHHWHWELPRQPGSRATEPTRPIPQHGRSKESKQPRRTRRVRLPVIIELAWVHHPRAGEFQEKHEELEDNYELEIHDINVRPQ